MSRSKDQRIVEMELQNRNFEAHAKESLSTIEKLKQALKFEGVENGFVSIENGIHNINLTSIIKGVDEIKNKFSALGIFGVETMKRITNAALDAGEKMWASTFGQIKSGGSSRALNIANSQFKLEGLGVAWKDAAKDINQAVDGTAYSFDAAANTAAQLSTAGIQLGEAYGGMAHSLRAVSGIATMTNSSYEEIGYIFSQIASAGRLMGQDAMQISTRGINVTATLAKQLNKTTEEIQDMQRKGEISFAMFAEAMNDAFGDQATKANNTFQGALSNVKSALSRIGEIWYGPFYNAAITPLNKIREAINKIKKEFSDGNDETRDFRDRLTDLMNIVSNIFSYLIETANLDFFRKIADGLNTIMDAAIRVGRSWEKFLGITKKTDETTTQIDDVKKSLKDLTDEELALAKRAANGEFGNGDERIRRLKELTDNYELVQMAVNECAASGWDWAKVESQISKEQKDIEEHNDAFTPIEKFFYTVGRIGESTIHTLGSLKDTFINVVNDILSSFGTSFDFNAVADSVDSLFNKIEKAAESVRDFLKDNKDFKETLDAGWRIANNLWRVITAIGDTLGKIAGDYLKSFFNTFDFEKVLNDVYALSRTLSIAFNNIRNFVKNSDLESGFNTTFEVINNLYRLVSSVGRIIIDLLASIGIVFGETIGEIDGGGTTIVDITDKMATWVENLQEWLTENKIFVNAIRATVDFIKDLPKTITDVLNTINDKIKEFTGIDVKATLGDLGDALTGKIDTLKSKIEEYGGIFEYLKSVIEAAKEDNIVSSVKNFFSELFDFEKWSDNPGEQIDRLVDIITRIGKAVVMVIAVATLLSRVKRLFNKEEDEKPGVVTNTVQNAKSTFSALHAIVEGTKGIFNKINDTWTNMNNLLVSGSNLMKTIDMGIMAAAVSVMVHSLTSLSKIPAKKLLVSIVALAAVAKILNTFIKSVVKTINSNELKTIFAKEKIIDQFAALVASIGASIWLMSKAVQNIVSIPDPLAAFGAWSAIELLLITMMGTMEIIGNSSNMDKIGIESAALVLAMAFSINILSKAISRLASYNLDKMGLAFLEIIGLMGMYVLVVKEMSTAASKFNYETKDIYAMSVNMIAFGLSINLMSSALKRVAKLDMDIGQAAIAVGSLAALVGSYTTVVAVLSELNSDKSLMITFAATTLAYGFAMRNLANAINIVGQLDIEQIKASATAIGILFSVFATAIGVLAYVNTSSAESVTLIMAALAADLVSTGIMFSAVATSFGIACVLWAKAVDITIKAIDRFANADLTNLRENITTFVESLGLLGEGFINVAPTMGTAVGIFFNTIFNAIETSAMRLFAMLPILLGMYIDTFVANISTTIERLIRGIISIIKVLISENGEGKTLIQDLVESIIDLIVAILTGVANRSDEIVGFLVGATIKLLNAYATAISENKEEILAALDRAIGATIDLFLEATENNNQKALEIGGRIVGYILNGITGKATDSYNKIKEFVDARIRNFRDNFGLTSEDGRGSKLYAIGASIIGGFISAITENFTDAYNAAYSFFTNFRDGIEAGLNGIGISTVTEAGKQLLDAFIHKGLNENSPPPDTIEAGSNLILGTAIGAEEAWNNVKNTLVKIGSGILGDFANSISSDKLKESLTGGNSVDISSLLGIDPNDTELSITPVLNTDDFDSDYSSFLSQYGGSDYNLGTTAGLAYDIGDATAGSNGFYTSAPTDVSGLRSDVQDIAERIGRLEVRMDTGALVGALYAGIDEKLGEKQILAGRGVYA